MIVGIAKGAEYRLLGARVALGEAARLIAPLHRAFDMGDRERATALIAAAIVDVNGASYEIGKLGRDMSGSAILPCRCPNCERFFVERVGHVDCCTTCFSIPEWPFKPELCEIVQAGFQPLERK